MTDDVVLMPLIPMVAMFIFYLVTYDIREDAITTLIIGTGTSAWAYFVLALAFIVSDPPTSYTILALLAVCVFITMFLCWLKKWSCA